MTKEEIANAIVSCGHQLKKKKEHLLSLEERKAEFIDVRAIPPDFTIIETNLRKEIVEIERRLEELQERKPVPLEGDFRLPPEKIFLSKLPTTSSELFGREKELALLDTAWADPHTHIVSIVAWGGVGKTALVNEWLNQMELDNYRGAERVYGWSFYSQGTLENRPISADEFIFHALDWFGDSDPTQGHPYDKGVRLAGLIRQQRTLLILDGMEPLQYPTGEMQGRLREQGLQALLKELARSPSGLCVITTRVTVNDLEHAVKSSVKYLYLEHLSPEAGAKLLETLGVKGSAIEVQAAVQEFKGHALALNLLGRYLAVVHDGDIRKRDLIPLLIEEEEQGGHARRVMESYERWLSGTPELNILYMMGLFDRPAKREIFEILFRKNIFDVFLKRLGLQYLVKNIHNISDTKWKYTITRLRDLRLLPSKNEGNSDFLDCHPLVRDYFGEKLKQKNPKSWKEAHTRLYEYYKNLPEKELPDSLEEMEPLFIAVKHGCQAGQYQDALNNVYWKRIRRKGSDFAVKRFGIFDTELAILSNFFEVPWNVVTAGLNDKSKAFVFNLVGFRLMATGRLEEAIQPFQSALAIEKRINDWKSAAQDTGNLSELFLYLGNIEQANSYARESVNFADRLDDWLQQLTSRTWEANSLFQAGKFSESELLFHEAESILKKNGQKLPFLYSLQGFWFCDLLLSQKKYQETIERASYALNIARENNLSLYTVALDNLSLGCAFRELSQIKQEKQKRTHYVTKAQSYLDRAVDGLREAGVQHLLSRSLIARAGLSRIQNDFPKAWDDLLNAQEIIERSSINLYLADYHLEASRLCLAEEKYEDAQQHLSTAETMIKEMGYHLRDKEVEKLTVSLKAIIQ